MTYEQAAKQRFRCRTCQGPLEKIRAHYGCTSPGCWQHDAQVAYRKKLDKLRHNKRRK